MTEVVQQTTSVGAPGASRPPGADPATLRLFTVEEYQRMGELGVLGEDDQVELIEGRILEMSPVGITLVGCVDFLNDYLHDCLPRKEYIVRVQSPLRTGDTSEPEPDLAVLKRRADMYRRSAAGPSDVAFVIEVSDTTLRYDRDTKVPHYARSGIPEVFIVDVQGQTMERYSEPRDDSYAVLVRVGGDEEIASTMIPQVVFRVSEVLASSAR